MPTILTLENVSKVFSLMTQEKTLFSMIKSVSSKRQAKRDFWALKDVSFTIEKGDKIALLGLNGAGKTTLIRIIAGILNPSAGKIISSVAFAPVLSYSSGMLQDLPVIDNIQTIGAMLGIDYKEVISLTPEILNFSELQEFSNLPVRHLSSGQQQRLAFSIFIHNKKDFWAFDESTSMADMSFRKKADDYFNHVMSSEKTMIISTHQLDFAEKHCNRAIWLEKGQIKKIGEISEVTAAYQKKFK